jgi:hypothetical protein
VQEDTSLLPQIRAANADHDVPHRLERIITLRGEPIATCYDNKGALYILDSTKTLSRVYAGESMTQHLNLSYDAERAIEDLHEERYMQLKVMPSIAVGNGFVYLVVEGNIERYDLSTEQQTDFIVPDGIGMQRKDRRFRGPKFHDVIMEEGNVLCSLVSPEGQHQIVQWRDGETHEAVVSWMPEEMRCGITFEGDEQRLSLGVFNGHLFYPQDEKLVAYTTGGPRSMLSQYRTGKKGTPMHPISKFAFGNDFLVAQLYFDDVSPERQVLPLMGIFRPVFEEGVVTTDQLPCPSYFQRVHVGYFPRSTNYGVTARSIAAKKDSFVVSCPAWREVHIYTMI